MRTALPRASKALLGGVAILGLFVLASPACDLARAAVHAPPHAMRSKALPGIDTRALAVGARAPAFSLPGADGATHRLVEHLGDGPAVVIFYRGFW